jgi:hypothetical protein
VELRRPKTEEDGCVGWVACAGASVCFTDLWVTTVIFLSLFISDCEAIEEFDTVDATSLARVDSDLEVVREADADSAPNNEG